MPRGDQTRVPGRPEFSPGLLCLGLGLLAGCAPLLLAWTLDLNSQGLPLTWASLQRLHQANPLHWIIDTTPLVLGGIGWFSGARQRRLRDLLRHEAAAERVARLQGVTAGLSQAATPAEVAGVVVEQGVAAIGGFAGFLRLVSADGAWLELVHTYQTPPEFARDWSRLPVDSPMVPGQVVRSHQPVVVSSREELRRSDPALHQSLPRFACDGTTVVMPLIISDRSIGLLSIHFDRVLPIDAQALAMIDSVATQGAQALERARLYAAAQQARAHDAFLAEAGRLLTGSLDYQTTLTTVARLAIPSLADSCIIDLADADGVLQPLVILHHDPSKVGLIEAMRRRYPVQMGTTNPVAWVMQAGHSWFEPEITNERLAEACVDEEHIALVKRLGYRSSIIVPLVAREQILGALSLRRGGAQRPFDRADLALIEELARRAGQAIDNARLFDAEQLARRAAERAVDRTARLQAVTAALGEALTATRVAQLLVDLCRATLGASRTSLLVPTADQTLAPIGAATTDHPLVVDGPEPASAVYRSGEPLWLETGASLSQLAGPAATATSAAPDGAMAVLPLVVNGRRFGVLLLGFAAARGFDNDDRSFLLALVGQAAQTLARIELAEAEQQARALAAQRATEARFRSLVQHSSDLISIIDTELMLRDVTPSIERLLGYQTAEVIGRALSELCHPDDRSRLWQAVLDAVARPDTPGVVVWRVQHRRGDWRYVETMVTNLLADPAVDGLVLNTRDISDHKALEEQLTHQAFHDPLTGLANRLLFHNRLQHAVQRAGRTGRPVTVLFLDLDNFKTINDSFGHDEGDLLLKRVAERLTAGLRDSDTVARLGGDEFAVLLEQETLAEGVAVAERLGSLLQRPLLLAQTEIVVSTSIGIARSEIGQTRVDELLRNADVAMYTAKSRGKGGYAIFEPGMHAAVLARLALEADLRQAIEQRQFELHYQPIIDLASGQLIGVEALLRWQHPQHGPIAPARFIPVAEETGLIRPLGRWALGEACRQVRHWQTQPALGAPGLTVSVNLSCRQLQAPDIVAEVATALAEANLPATHLTLEITESTVMQDTTATIQTLTALRHLGVQLAIDDFGTGYSSLHYLRRFPIDVLKIDKGFVEALDQESDNTDVARLIVQLGQTLGLTTVAEGIERRAQLEHLRRLGCQRGQGYLFTRPVDGPTLEELLRQPTWRALWLASALPAGPAPATG